MGSGKVLASVLAGAAAGAVLGILFAPDKGIETRRRIAEIGFNLAGSVKDKFTEYADATDYCPTSFEGITFKIEEVYGKTDVFIAGSFNDWKEDAWKMEQFEYGTFIFQIKLNSGKYYYKYFIDNEWILDPNNPVKELDKNGNLNSVLIVT